MMSPKGRCTFVVYRSAYAGARIFCFAVANPSRDIFLEMLEIELELPSDRAIREVMEAEAQRQGLEISKSKLGVAEK